MSLIVILRIAAVISLLFAAGHTYGGQSSWSPIGETETLRAMREFHMVISGVSRSYHDFYIGFGYSLSVFMVLQAVLLWLLANLAKTHPDRVRPFVAALFVASIVGAIITWRFIFPIPAAISLVLTALLGVAYYSASVAQTRIRP
jgi:uncharacterized membrane protein